MTQEKEETDHNTEQLPPEQMPQTRDVVNFIRCLRETSQYQQEISERQSKLTLDRARRRDSSDLAPLTPRAGDAKS